MLNNRIIYIRIFRILVLNWSITCINSQFITTNIVIQSVVFVVSSTILLLLTKPLIKKFVKTPKTKPTNVYSIIGKEGIVLESIDNLNSTGKVKVNGELWSAISDNNIEKGETIKVLSVNGVKLKVEKVNEVSNAK